MQGRQAEPGGAKAPGGERFNDVNQQVVAPNDREKKGSQGGSENKF